jgi:hypothetical protein
MYEVYKETMMEEIQNANFLSFQRGKNYIRSSMDKKILMLWLF